MVWRRRARAGSMVRLRPSWTTQIFVWACALSPCSRRSSGPGGERLRVIRQNATRDPEVRLQAPDGLLRLPSVREGFPCLQRLGLTFGAWLYHPQVHDLVDLMEAFPTARAVLNNMAGRTTSEAGTCKTDIVA